MAKPLRQWIWSNQLSKAYLLLSIPAAIIQFILFKRIYPYPNFLPDSYSYLEKAHTNLDINVWPIGYSKFLRFFSAFTHSDTVLVLCQYIFLQITVLYFLYTILYFLQPGKRITHIVLLFGIFNPIFLHLSNFISSDALFTALSLIWITQLLWIRIAPTLGLVLLHAIVILLAFSIRYNALFYPVISIVVIAISQLSLRYRIIGIFLTCGLISSFSAYTVNEYRKATGTSQFSAFSGWQLASNALFMYAHVPQEDITTFPAKYRPLQAIVHHHNDSLSRVLQRSDSTLGIYYLWDESSPLKTYMNVSWKKDTTADNFKKWSSMAPLYTGYGNYLIRRYPAAFVHHYVLPNLKRYYVPNSEFLGIYNMGKDTVDQWAKIWFGYKTKQVKPAAENSKIAVTEFYPILMAAINLFFILSLAGFTVLGGFSKSTPVFRRILWLVLIFWLANLSFSVLASPIVLRYQVFPMIVSFPFPLLLLKFIMEADKPKSRPADLPTEDYGLLSYQ